MPKYKLSNPRCVDDYGLYLRSEITALCEKKELWKTEGGVTVQA
jgi:hypothetical protein